MPRSLYTTSFSTFQYFGRAVVAAARANAPTATAATARAMPRSAPAAVPRSRQPARLAVTSSVSPSEGGMLAAAARR